MAISAAHVHVPERFERYSLSIQIGTTRIDPCLMNVVPAPPQHRNSLPLEVVHAGGGRWTFSRGHFARA